MKNICIALDSFKARGKIFVALFKKQTNEERYLLCWGHLNPEEIYPYYFCSLVHSEHKGRYRVSSFVERGRHS